MWIYPEIKTLADVPTYHAKHRGDEKVFLMADRSITYNEWERESNRIANALIEKKVPRYSRIGFIGKNSEFYFYVFFGAVKAGSAFLPLNWRLTPAELVVILEDSAIPVLFADIEYKGTVEKILASSSLKFDVVYINPEEKRPEELEQWIASADSTRPKVDINNEDVAFQLYTSGTTGVPKGVELSVEGVNFWFLLLELEPALDHTTKDVTLFVAPNFHLLQIHFGLVALYNGAKLSIVPEVRIDKVIEAIARDRVTLLILAPVMIGMLLDAPNHQPDDFSSLKMVVYAGAPIGLTLLQRALKEMKCEFMQFYGTTEIGGGVTLLRPKEHDLENEEKLKSCGRPLPFTTIKVMDFNGCEAGVGQPGEWWVRIPTLFKKYYNQPELTAEVLIDGWYNTGDVGYYDEEGFYYLVDRTKDMIISGGENIYSIEVEQALLKHPAVQNVAVIGVPHEKWGEAVKALVVLKAGATATPEELIAHCRELIAGYKIPKSYAFLDTLPTSPAGKVLKKLLR
ncbi:MAG: AMP-binding protein [Desulfobacterales bacterium]|jgi:acyl-CoA synthetase (AMP-forming)/AMP-acid ligase II|nr:AMP-binding protein [Desulfobacterales bacterium]